MKIVPQSVELVDSMGSDLSVVNAARVSFQKESEWEQDPSYFGNRVLSEKDQKLIAYLARHNHWTPFGHAFLSFRIKAPIFVARQLVKHQVGLVWNEVSRRYVDDEPEFFQLKWRMRADNVKQGSAGEFSDEDQRIINYVFWEVVECSFKAYETLLEKGVAPEQARAVLNLNHMTEWIWSGSVAAFARVCKLRLDPHAQAETREIAEHINRLVPEQFKYSWNALLH
jgi:thymidylate synthase (FAD)